MSKKKSAEINTDRAEDGFQANAETCRLCLTNGAKINIFKCIKTIPEMLNKISMICCELQIYQNDGLPEFICKSCLNKINQFIKFKRLCKTNDEILRRGLNQKQIEIKIEVPVLIKEEYNDDDDHDYTPEVEQNFIDCNNEKYIEIPLTENPKIEPDFNENIQEQKTIKSPIKQKISAKIKKCSEDDDIAKKCKTVERSNLCPICGKYFSKSHSLSMHIQMHGTEKKYFCNECPKSFVTKSQMAKHANVHSDKRNFSCELCGKTYKTSSHAKMHNEIVHQKVRAVSCDMCKKTFNCSSNLRMHMKIHTGEREHECEFCHRKFTFKVSLTLHRRVHTGEKPYACRFCDGKFAVSKTLKDHERIHTGETPYVCPVCSKAFMQKSNMKSHFRNNHKGQVLK